MLIHPCMITLTCRSVKGVRQGGVASVSGRSAAAGGRAGAKGQGNARLMEGLDEPMDLLDASTSRKLVKSAAGGYNIESWFA